MTSNTTTAYFMTYQNNGIIYTIAIYYMSYNNYNSVYIYMSTKSYHKCAKETGKCVGLKQGIKGYHKCARVSNCKKPERTKLEGIKERLKVATAKKVISKVVKKAAVVKFSDNDIYDMVNKLYNKGFGVSMITPEKLKKFIEPKLDIKTKTFDTQFKKAIERLNNKTKPKPKPKLKNFNPNQSKEIKAGDKYYGYNEIVSGHSITSGAGWAEAGGGIESIFDPEVSHSFQELDKYVGSRITKRTKASITITKGNDKPFTKKYYKDAQGFEYVKVPYKTHEGAKGQIYIYYYDSNKESNKE